MKDALKYLKNTYRALIKPICNNRGYDITIRSNNIIEDAQTILIDMLDLYNQKVVVVKDSPFGKGRFLIFEWGNINVVSHDLIMLDPMEINLDE